MVAVTSSSPLNSEAVHSFREELSQGHDVIDPSISLPGQIGLPGLRHSIGLARWWNLGVDTLWLAGIVFLANHSTFLYSGLVWCRQAGRRLESGSRILRLATVDLERRCAAVSGRSCYRSN